MWGKKLIRIYHDKFGRIFANKDDRFLQIFLIIDIRCKTHYKINIPKNCHSGKKNGSKFDVNQPKLDYNKIVLKSKEMVVRKCRNCTILLLNKLHKKFLKDKIDKYI